MGLHHGRMARDWTEIYDRLNWNIPVHMSLGAIRCGSTGERKTVHTFARFRPLSSNQYCRDLLTRKFSGIPIVDKMTSSPSPQALRFDRTF